MLGAGYEPPFGFIPASRLRREGPHRPARRLRVRRGRHRHRPHRDRLRRGRLPPRRRAGPERHQPGPDRRHLRRAHRPVRGALRQGGRRRPDRGSAQRAAGSSAPSGCCTATRTAGAAARRCSTTPSRPGTSARRRCAIACWPPTTASTGIPSTSRTGRMGRWLENNVDWALSRERYWGTPLPIWRNEAGETVLHRLLRGAQGAQRRRAHRSAPPVRGRRRDPVADRRRAAAARPRGDRRLVRLRVDAVRAVALPVREPGEVRRAVPGGLHLRGDRPDARLVLQPARDLDAAQRPELLQDRALPRPHRRPAGPQDVQVARQHRRRRGTSSTATARTRSAGTS